MGGAMKDFLKKLLGHETFRSMVSWAMKIFLKNPPALPSYILNVRSLIATKLGRMVTYCEEN